MTDLVVLAAVKFLKIAILGTLSLVSQFAHSDDPSCMEACNWSASCVQVAVVTHVAPLREVPSLPELPTIHVRSARIRRLAPPIRVEMMFAPDLLSPPIRDLNL